MNRVPVLWHHGSSGELLPSEGQYDLGFKAGILEPLPPAAWFVHKLVRAPHAVTKEILLSKFAPMGEPVHDAHKITGSTYFDMYSEDKRQLLHVSFVLTATGGLANSPVQPGANKHEEPCICPMNLRV